MKCPFCRQAETEVYNTRSTRFGTQLWRRRRCQSCHEAFTTYEAVNLSFLRIGDPNGHTSRFSRSKLYSSLAAALLGLPQSANATDALTDTIEAKVLDLQQRVVASSDIVHLTLTTLKAYNTAAFLRYLASHTDVSSPAQFKRELKKY